jgi:drug/metabolite transporter (DMT)-like permease
MPTAALLLVLFAALCHATWNLVVKADVRRLEIQSGALVVGTFCCAPVLLIYSPWELSGRVWVLILLSAAFETAYVLALTAGYAAGELSLVYPIARGSAPVLVAPLAVMLLGERLSPRGVGGIALVVLGILVSHGTAGGLAAARTHGRAVAWALLTGVFIAGYSLVNKLGVTLAPVPLYAFLVFLIDAVLVFAVQGLWRREMPVLRRRAPWGKIVAVGVLMMSAYLAVLAAMSLARVSYVVAAREVSVVVAALLGVVALRERHSVSRIAGAGLIFGGLCLIALAR